MENSYGAPRIVVARAFDGPNEIRPGCIDKRLAAPHLQSPIIYVMLHSRLGRGAA